MRRPKSQLNKFIRNTAIAFALFLLIAGIFSLYNTDSSQKPVDISLNKLVEQINKEQVKSVQVIDNNLEITLKSGEKEKTQKEQESSLSETLKNYGVKSEKLAQIQINIKDTSASKIWGNIFVILIPVLFIIGLFYFMGRQMKGAAGKALKFGEATARMFKGKSKERKTFRDVAGVKEAKEELIEVVDFLRNPGKYLKIGARIPRGVLLVGSPGTGKTLLAKAVANEANVPFLSMSGSEFMELFVGVGASRVRDLFNKAKKEAPSIIFIDEIDSIGGQRGMGITAHEEREQTLNQILAEMDGFTTDDRVIVMAATNRPDLLDLALLRPGRFDRTIVLNLPDIKEREAILKIHCRNKPLDESVDFKELAERTPGFSGADLANMVNEAAILTAKNGKKKVSQKEMLASIDKVLLGPERKSHVLSKKEKRIAAFHEAGHALVSHFLPYTDPIRKVSIVARGIAGGFTLKLPEEEKHMYSKAEFLDELAVLLAGYATEKETFKDITTGAANDLVRATKLARDLVTVYGMSELGPVVLGEKRRLKFLNLSGEEERNYSEETATKIDKEISKLINQAQEKAKDIVKNNKKRLDQLAEVLIKKETIERKEFEKIMGKKKKKLGM